MVSLGETFVNKSYAKGQKMIRKSNSKSTVSPSRRGEGSRAKPVAKRVSPSKRGEGKANLEGFLAMKKKTAKIQESAVTNLPITVAKGLIALGKKGKMQPREPKPHTLARLKTTAKKTPDRPKTLYHGTATPKDLPKGTRLSTGSGATTNYKFAESYAKGRAVIPSLSGRSRVLIVKNSKTSQHQKNRDGTVKWKSPKNEYKSPKGFVIKGEAKKPKVSKPKMKPGAEGPKRSVPRKKK